MQTDLMISQVSPIAGAISNVEKPVHQNSTANKIEFDVLLQSLEITSKKPSPADAGNIAAERPNGIESTTRPDRETVSKAFEAMLVSQFLAPLFTGSGASMFGDGVQGDITKSLLTDAIAQAITERGGIGLGKFF